MKNKKIKIGVVFGGKSGEHEVSLVSAQSIIKALDKKKYDIVPIGITKEGRWISGELAMDFLKSGSVVTKKITHVGLLPDSTQKGLIKISDKLNALKNYQYLVDVFFPVLHGVYGEDGSIQGLFELANVPYVGCDVLGSAIGMDKVIQNQLYDWAGIKQMKYFWFLSKDWPKKSIFIKKQSQKLGYPVFIKPANLGSSIGITKAHCGAELKFGIKKASNYNRKILVEKSAENCQEIECSVLGNDKPKASIPGEIIASNEFYDYEAKYIDGKSKIIIPAKLPKSIIKKIQNTAITVFKILNLSGLARVDFFVRLKTKEVFINEVNTMPGFTPISMYPKLWEASGLPYPDLLDELIKLAQERWLEKSKLLNTHKPKNKWYNNS